MNPSGLTTEEAFSRLHQVISGRGSVLRRRLAEDRMINRQFPGVLWFTEVLTCFVSFFIGHMLSPDQAGTPANIIALLILILLIGSAFLAVCKRSNSLLTHATQRTNQILTDLEFLCGTNKTNNDVLPYNLQSDVQLVYRDGVLMNIPVLLLVHGDVVLLKHGQVINFSCRHSDLDFEPGSIFAPKFNKLCINDPDFPQRVSSEQLVEVLVTESPLSDFFVSHTFESRHHALSPLSRFVLLSSTLCSFTWIGLGVLFCVRIAFHIAWTSQSVINRLTISWMLLFAGKFIFYSAGFDSWLLWRIAVAFICSRFRAIEQGMKDRQLYSNRSFDGSFGSHSVDNTLFRKHKFTFYRWMRRESWGNWFEKLYHEVSKLYQSELDNSVLTLGGVSSVCCVQKDGILSRPALTPEKVFFFRKRHHHHHWNQDLLKSLHTLVTPEATIHSRRIRPKLRTNLSSFIPNPASQTVPRTNDLLLSPVDSRRDRTGSFCSELDARDLVPGERKRAIVPIILNLRTDTQWPHLPQFGKPKWTHYLASLKPIGLALLLNNAHTLARPRQQFWEHLRSLRPSTDVVECYPDPLFSCQCCLARRIGFKASAVRGFTCCGSLGAYVLGAHVVTFNNLLRSHDEIRKSLSSTSEARVASVNLQDSCMIEHAFSAVFTNPSTPGDYQLMTQATGDMLVALCSDFWDGRDVSSLSSAERDAMLDFYHRNASAAYCVGFSYAPLLGQVPAIWSNDKIQGRTSIEDPILIRLPHWKSRDWIDKTHSTLVVFDHSDHLISSRPASARFADTTPSSIDLGYRNPDTHRPVLLGNKQAQSAFTTPYLLSPTSESHSSPCAKWVQADHQTIPDNFTACQESQEPFTAQLECSGALYSSGSLISKVSKRNHSVEPLRNKIEGVPYRDDGEEWHTLLGNQIFLGLISMQYQVRTDVVEAIKQLDQACIRFVYFSRENELRSRVFAERLGLECGWNCHISLANPSERPYTASGRVPEAGEMDHINHDASVDVDILSSGNSRHDLVQSFTNIPNPNIAPRRMNSVPIIAEIQRPLSESVVSIATCEPNSNELDARALHVPVRRSLPTLDMRKEVDQTGDVPSVVSSANDVNLSSSSSSSTSTSSLPAGQADQSGGFCTSRLSYYVTENKSRLPCGIDHIRPHLQNVDNVPLQVSLFTDCSTTSMREMIRIRQEYDETVCVVGSSYAVDSLRLMHYADVALAIQPELPTTCEAFSYDGTEENFAESEQPFVTTSHCVTQSEHGPAECVPLNSSRDREKASGTYCVIRALDLTARLVCSLSPAILYLDRPGFHIYELIHEAHASVNNLYLSFGLHWLAPLPFTIIQLLLLSLGLPTMPYRLVATGTSNSTDESVLWLPLESLRVRLVPLTNEVLLRSPSNTAIRIAQTHMARNPAWLAPDFGTGQWLWFVLVVTPILSLSVLDRRVERNQPLREPPVKRGKWLTKRKVIRVLLVTTTRFLPSVLVCVLSAVGHFYFAPGFHFCTRLNTSACPLSNVTSDSVPSNHSEELEPTSYSCQQVNHTELSDMCFTRLAILVRLMKDFTFLQLVWYLVFISLSYANFGQSIGKFRWSTNPFWCISASFILGIQTMWFLLHGLHWNDSLKIRNISVLHPVVIILGTLWCPILIAVNEIVSWKERRMIYTEHRLARLYFGTKLGMYSPV